MTTTEEALDRAARLQADWNHPDMHDAADLIRALVAERDEALLTLSGVRKTWHLYLSDTPTTQSQFVIGMKSELGE